MTHVHKLRRDLGEGVIETVIGRGYRFVADVDSVEVAETVRAIAPVVHLVEPLADALARSGTTPTVVLIVTDAQGARLLLSTADDYRRSRNESVRCGVSAACRASAPAS